MWWVFGTCGHVVKAAWSLPGAWPSQTAIAHRGRAEAELVPACTCRCGRETQAAFTSAFIWGIWAAVCPHCNWTAFHGGDLLWEKQPGQPWGSGEPQPPHQSIPCTQEQGALLGDDYSSGEFVPVHWVQALHMLNISLDRGSGH